MSIPHSVVVEKLNVYLAVVILNPTQKAVFEEGETPQIIVQPTAVLATDENQASGKAMRLVPEEFAKKLDRLEVKLLPF